MGFTITEKILARASGTGSVNAGDELLVKPDFVIAYDFPGYTDVIFKQMEDEFGIKTVSEPDRFALFIDHMVPATTTQEEELHQNTRSWGKKNNVPVYERKGIGHQVAAELGYATPGAFVVHFDGHISQLGTFGALAIGVRRHLLEAFVKDRIKFKVPETTRIDIIGNLQLGVTARDIFHHIVRELGPRSCRGTVLELGGETIEQLSLESRQTITCLAMFTGAITAIINPDKKSLDYIEDRKRKNLDALSSDPDANYAARYTVDVTDLEPIVVVPPSPANTSDLAEFIGTEVHVGYLGSCASGRVEDLALAADVLEGHKIKEGFQLHVVPTSQEIMEKAAESGIISRLIKAGAFLSSSSCDYCFGRMGVMRAGQRAVSTGTLNVRGRMGSPDSEIFIVNAAAVAAAAIEGRIADPRPYLRK